MKEILRLQEKNIDQIKDTFGIYLPGTKTTVISYDDLPESLKILVDGEKNCGLSLQIIHPNKSKTLIAEYKDFDVYFLQDRNTKNTFTGEGRIYIESGLDGDIPVVGFTRTPLKYQNQGLGTRRLFIMNALSNALYDSPIHSSGSPRIAQKLIWEKLVSQEFAEITEFQGTQRYKFS